MSYIYNTYIKYQYVSVYVCVKTLISFLKLSLFDFTVCGAQSFSWRAALIAYKLAAFAFLVESKTVFIEFIYLSLRQLLLSFLPKKYQKNKIKTCKLHAKHFTKEKKQMKMLER